MSYFVGNPEHRFSHGEAHIIKNTIFFPNDPFSYSGRWGGHLMHFSRGQARIQSPAQLIGKAVNFVFQLHVNYPLLGHTTVQKFLYVCVLILS